MSASAPGNNDRFNTLEQYMQIEAVLFLKGSPVAIDWHAGTLTSNSTLLIDALLLMEEAYTGTAIGLPGYPPSYSACLGDPPGL
jgi:hypothetical protein